MPCGWRPGGSEWANEIAEQQERKLGLLENMLCEVLTAVEASGKFYEIVNARSPVAQWWIGHKEKDRKLKQEIINTAKAQELRDRAIAKLSVAEREALGIRKR